MIDYGKPIANNIQRIFRESPAKKSIIYTDVQHIIINQLKIENVNQ